MKTPIEYTSIPYDNINRLTDWVKLLMEREDITSDDMIKLIKKVYEDGISMGKFLGSDDDCCIGGFHGD